MRWNIECVCFLASGSCLVGWTYLLLQILPYELLLRSLQVPTIRELEDLIIDGIYADLMRGKLDQKEQQFEVEYTIGRDLGPGKIQALLASLHDWSVVMCQ